jgi:hypothetical protein
MHYHREGAIAGKGKQRMKHSSGLIVHTDNLHTLEAKGIGFQVKISLGYIARACFKKKLRN